MSVAGAKQGPSALDITCNVVKAAKLKKKRQPQTPLKELVPTCITEYNEFVKHNTKYQIVGGKRTMELLLCAFQNGFIEALEQHYSKYRHTESALGVHNLADESLRPGTVRVKDPDINNIWSEIRTVTENAVMIWTTRVIKDFESAAPPKSSPKKKKDCQPGAEALGEMMCRSCLYAWLMTPDHDKVKVMTMLSGAKLAKFQSMWAQGLG